MRPWYPMSGPSLGQSTIIVTANNRNGAMLGHSVMNTSRTLPGTLSELPVANKGVVKDLTRVCSGKS